MHAARRRALVGVAFLPLCLGLAVGAEAATLTVTSSADSRANSLRAAMTAAAPGDTGGNGFSGDGGAAAGPAIFVRLGSVTITNSGASGQVATPGAGAGSGTSGTADAAPVFNLSGTVNGSATVGPMAAALGTAQPVVLPVPMMGVWAMLLLAGGLALAGYRRGRAAA